MAKKLAKAWLKQRITGGLKSRTTKEPSLQRHNKALVVKAPWVDLLLDGKKTWEIRSQPTKVRGVVKLAQSGTGRLVGQARIIDCVKIKRAEFPKYFKKHRVPDLKAILNYRHIYAWVIRDAARYVCPPRYDHPAGAIIWVNL